MKINNQEVQRQVKEILNIKLLDGKNLKNHIWFQEYSDILRRIILLSIGLSPDYEIDLYPNLTYKCKKHIYDIIKHINAMNLDINDWLKISIASGLIGITSKSTHAATSLAINRKIGIQLNIKDEPYQQSIIRIGKQLLDASRTKTKIDASNFFFNLCEQSNGIPLRILTFTDDYIETIFLFAYYEKLIELYKNIEIDVIPKSIKCGNDATYADSQDFLHFFSELRYSPRFRIHKNGPKLATVNLQKLHPSIIDLVNTADIIDIRGARNFETMQGIRKEAYFGFMVSREFSESVIGLSSELTPLIYLRQMPGEKSFEGFNMRHKRPHNDIFLCTRTANDCREKLQGGHISSYQSWSPDKIERFKTTQHFYQKNNLDFHKKYGDYLELNVKKFLNKMNNNILVVGCGSGKEVGYLHQNGKNAIGIDISFEAIKLATLRHPELWDCFLIDDLYNIEFIEDSTYSGIVFNASLVHLLDRDDLFSILSYAKKIVKNNGFIFLRVLDKDGVIEEYDNSLFGNKRWFVYYDIKYISDICSRLNFNIVKTEKNKHHLYENVYWISILVKNKK